MSDILDTLRQEGVDPALLTAVQEYRAAHPLSETLRPRIPAPAFIYYGKEVWEQALAAILCGEKPAAGRRKGHRQKTCWQKTLPPPLAAPRGTSPFM